MDTAALLAQIHATPSDRELRSVYADALQAAGDPRGEFVALQLAGPTDPRFSSAARALLEQHWRTWCGPVAICTSLERIEFRDGFLTTVEIDHAVTETRLGWFRIQRAAEWSTVESLHIASRVVTLDDHVGGILRYSPLRALRELHAPMPALAHLHERPPRLTRVTATAHQEPFALAPGAIHGAHLVVQRTGWHHGDPADVSTWQLALDAELASLEIAPLYGMPDLGAHLVSALATRRRPAEIRYRFHDLTLAIRPDELELSGADGPRVELLRVLEPVLHRFARVRFEGTFTGAGPAASAWLARHPRRARDDDEGDDDD